MAKPQCPLPHVEDALSPYIHSREKTTRIRQILTHAVTKHVADDNELSHLSLSSPPLSLRAQDTAIPADGLYKQYLLALQAHREAQEKYHAVKSELSELLQHNSSPYSDQTGSSSTERVQQYAQVLRQRRQQRKLEIVQDTLTCLLDTDANPSEVDLKASIREELGEPPQAPSAAFESNTEADSRVEQLTFQLKKQLLLAKNQCEAAKSAKSEAEARGTKSNGAGGEDGIRILQDARDELITWVETELAKIPEDEIEASQADISFLGDDDVTTNGFQISPEEFSQQSQDLYNAYVQSRQEYIATIESTLPRAKELESAVQTKPELPTSPPRRRPTVTSVNSHSDKEKVPQIQASQLLPYFTTMSSAAKSETLLQQQAVHIRRQLGIASQETTNVIQRMAGESLLVPQDSKSMTAWATAARDAGAKTTESVLEHVKEGEESIGNAKAVLDGLSARKKGLASIKRGA